MAVLGGGAVSSERGTPVMGPVETSGFPPPLLPHSGPSTSAFKLLAPAALQSSLLGGTRGVNSQIRRFFFTKIGDSLSRSHFC